LRTAGNNGSGGRLSRRAVARIVWVLVIALAVVLSWTGWRIYLSNARVDSGEFAVWRSPERNDRILVFAPHCDDETLAAGGIIQRAKAVGAEVRVVFMTNGDGFSLSAGREFAKVRLKPEDYVRLGLVRQNEAQAALKVAGLAVEDVTFLGYPDQGLAPMWMRRWLPSAVFVSPHTGRSRSPYLNSYTRGALYCGASVLADVRRVIEEFGPTLVLCPHPSDNHPDHWATYAFVTTALYGRERQNRPPLAQGLYIVHRGDWPVPQGYHPADDLAPPAALAGLHTSWYRFPLSVKEEDSKLSALKAYVSQVSVMKRFLLSFVRTNELLGVRSRGTVTDVPDGSIQIDGYVDDWGRAPVSVRDPEGDSLPVEVGGAGDIGTVRVARDSRRLYFLLTTRKAVSPAVAYEFAWHALPDTGSGTGTAVLRIGRPLPPGVAARRRGNVWEVSVPRPQGEALLVSVASAIPGFEVDRSGWRVLEPPGAHQSTAGSGTSGPSRRISGQAHATAATTRMVPTPPATTDTTAPNHAATTPLSKAPSSLDAPMNRLLTADTRPRNSSGVHIWTSD
jgi:LmbE family N-acetylglucosaminyl deacetylase